MTRYESTGTWFDPAEVAKRKRRWAGMVVSVDPGDPTCVGVWLGGVQSPGLCTLKPGEYNVEWIHDECLIIKKEPAMTK